MQDLISVIIPIYNVEKFLDRTLKCVCGQTYKNLEILLVDDGSTDGSGAICDRYAAEDSRIRVFHKKNGGSSSARNLGIREATGRFIGFLDSDDWIEPDMYETLYTSIQEHPECAIAQIMSQCYYENGELAEGPMGDSGKTYVLSPKEYYRQLMLYVGDSSCCTKLFRADFMKAHQFSEGRLNEDFELLLNMSLEIEGLVTTEKVGYNIVYRSGSNTRAGYKPELYEAMLANAEFAHKVALEHYPDCEPEARHFFQMQGMWYLLHIPTSLMTRDNELYQMVKKRLWTMRSEIRTSPYLKPEFRRNLLILTAISPKAVRVLHGWWMKVRGK